LKEVDGRTIKKTLYGIEEQWRKPKHATLFSDLLNLRIIGRKTFQAVEVRQTWK
jgi:hypothetical protein